MNFETSKIKLDITDTKIVISDRIPIKFMDISIFLTLTSILAIFLLGLTGIVYALIFSIGYVLFRYFAWVIWKNIEINLKDKRLIIDNMIFHKKIQSEIVTEKFIPENLKLKEFEQSGMKRAMIQYRSHKVYDLLLLTHLDDIELVKTKVFKTNIDILQETVNIQ